MKTPAEIDVEINKKTTRFAHGAAQLFIALDQMLNVMTNPFSTETWADETLSSRCGRLGHRYPYKFWKAIIDPIFRIWQGPDHCVNAYLKEQARYNCPPAMRLPPKTL
jgi:hypothetical protein